MKYYEHASFASSMFVLVVVFIILVSLFGCASGRGVTTADRLRDQCELVGGDWTSTGCNLGGPS